jgi:hypothetical protein
MLIGGCVIRRDVFRPLVRADEVEVLRDRGADRVVTVAETENNLKKNELANWEFGLFPGKGSLLI